MSKIIRNQVWIEYEDYLELILLEPFWSAYKFYKGFKDREWGIGIAIEAINMAQKVGKKIRIRVVKYGIHEISAKKTLDYIENSRKTADHGIVLVIPHSKFKTILPSSTVEEVEKKEDIRLKINQARQIELL